MNPKKEPLVSVVIPCFNTPSADLCRSIESVLRQDYSNIELIIVDDGSFEPFSGLKLSERLFSSRFIRWIPLSENRGVSAARNSGILKSKGDYIAFLDAGDWWAEEKVSAQVAVMSESSAVGLVYCGAEFHPLDGSPSWVEMRDVTEDAYRALLVRQAISGSASAAMVRRDIIAKLGGFEETLEIPEDREMWLRISKHADVVLVPRILTHIEVNPESRSSNPQKKAESYRCFLNIYDEDMRKEGVKREAWSHYHIVIAKKFYSKKQYFMFFKHVLLSFLWNPVFLWRGVKKTIKDLI